MQRDRAEIVRLFEDMIVMAVRESYSDLHITGNQSLVYRKNGIIGTLKDIQLSFEEIDSLVKSLLSPVQLHTLRNRWSVDLALSVKKTRLRLNVFNTTRGLSFAVRILPGTVPTIEMLNLHPSLTEISKIKSGLVLICGVTGSGKTTTIAALIDEINRLRPAHIVTLEDPVEFRFASKQSFIEQREIGTHVPSFRRGLLDVLREDPDVIVVGEIRDPEEIRLCLSAAESGHLVIATLHAGSAEDAMYRICNSFPPEAQEEIRFQLASTLAWVIIQHLVYMERLKYRVPHLAIVKASQSVKTLIRENKLHQMENTMHTSKREGMFTKERYLDEFLNAYEAFTHPSHSFRPTPESIQETTYVSPLVDEVASEAAPYRPAQAPVRRETLDVTLDITEPVIAPLSAPAGERQYVIDETESLESMIAQLGKSGGLSQK